MSFRSFSTILYRPKGNPPIHCIEASLLMGLNKSREKNRPTIIEEMAISQYEKSVFHLCKLIGHYSMSSDIDQPIASMKRALSDMNFSYKLGPITISQLEVLVEYKGPIIIADWRVTSASYSRHDRYRYGVIPHHYVIDILNNNNAMVRNPHENDFQKYASNPYNSRDECSNLIHNGYTLSQLSYAKNIQPTLDNWTALVSKNSMFKIIPFILWQSKSKPTVSD